MEITCKLMNFSKSENAGSEDIIIKNCEMNDNDILIIADNKEYLLSTDAIKRAVLYCSSDGIILNRD